MGSLLRSELFELWCRASSYSSIILKKSIQTKEKEWNTISRLFRNNHLITVLSSVLMLYLPFSNLNWMLIIKSVFSGAHTCTQSSNLKEKIRLFVFVFRFPTSWHSHQRPAFEWCFWGSHQSLFSVQQSLYSPPESVVFLRWLPCWQKEGGRERTRGVRSVF